MTEWVNKWNPERLQTVTTTYQQVNMDEDGGEEEMEWLMEELEAPPTSSSSSAHLGKSNHANGHITTKPVNTDGLRSFSLDEQDDDSEDEVLSVPGVRVVKSSGLSRHRSALLQVSTAICPISLTKTSYKILIQKKLWSLKYWYMTSEIDPTWSATLIVIKWCYRVFFVPQLISTKLFFLV